ncbi:histidine kinase dimerization/phospho-acceptor domain-containing protein [Bdellovibrio sp. HCB337]|uniref:histidine kinase dimerization/phospho-acceptor domain-containing protein n=1 Tax=Bdellovibrio sp. HCB337 TaxID=3394358 RepID=UPI0039A5CA77
MRPLKTSFLLIGPWEERLVDLGAQILPDLSQALVWSKEAVCDVVALSITSILEKKFGQFYHQVLDHNPAAQWIAVVPKDFAPEQLADIHELYPLFRVISSYQETDIEAHFFSALEEVNRQKQDKNLEKLIRDQKEQLIRLQADLEQRVEKRTKFLTEARRKLYQTNVRIEGLKNALMAVHKAGSLVEIEKLLNESMASTVQTSWIRIFFAPQDNLFAEQVETKLSFTQQRVPLFRQHERIGSIFFMRATDHPFLRDEVDFLNRVAEAVSLALGRIQKLEESEELKKQWEATFNAVSDPVAIIDTNYDIIQANSAITSHHPTGSVIGKKCFEVLYNRKTPCDHCQRGKNFRLDNKDAKATKSFEVYSQSLSLEPQKPAVFVNIYHDITQRLLMEKQLLETAKLAELGTIGSSIAHELNNPLGGILSFTQLIKMDLPKDHPMYPDILEMEAGSLRCKEIIQNLLGFTRNPNVDEITDLDLRDVIKRAYKIMELQLKSQAIEVTLNLPDKLCPARGHLNLLSQAIKNILQSAYDSILARHKNNTPEFKGQLDVSLELTADKYLIVVKNNGAPYEKESAGLGIPVASQIVEDHGGKLEISSSTKLESGPTTLAKISFPRPVLRS